MAKQTKVLRGALLFNRKARTSNPFPHFGSPTSQGMSPRITGRSAPATSRRQYLSRMDRFQHGRSGANFRTTGAPDQSKIAANPHPSVTALHRLPPQPNAPVLRPRTAPSVPAPMPGGQGSNTHDRAPRRHGQPPPSFATSPTPEPFPLSGPIAITPAAA